MMRDKHLLRNYLATIALVFFWTQPSWGQDAATDKTTQDRAKSSSPTTTLKIEPALDGYCPAAYILEGKALHGKPTFSSVYVGETYYFSSNKAKLAFDSKPEKYLPKLAGWCLMAMGGPYSNRIIANPEIFEVIDGSVYLFSSQRAKDFYEANPGGVVERANKIFGHAKLFGYCPVTYITHNQSFQGNPTVWAAYKRAVYLFVNDEAKHLFMENPSLYVPPYEGYSAMSLVDKKVLRANPQIFSIHEDKVYFFLNAADKQRFDKDPAAIIKRADPIWKKIQEKKIVRKGEDPNE